MTTIKEYPYDKGDLIKRPNTYFYTQYYGGVFIRLWKQRRITIGRLLGEYADPPEIRKPVPPSKLMKNIVAGDVRSTKVLLESLYAHLSRNRQLQCAILKKITDRIVKKFETTKHIHSAYGAGFRAKEKGAYKDLMLYVLAAEIFEAAYARFKELPYLNALLKCMDTLSSCERNLCGDLRGRVTRLVALERDHIAKLAGSAGVPL